LQIGYRDNTLDAVQTDWMEWQADYVSGALLMPASKVRELAGAYLESHGLFGVGGQRVSHGLALIESARTGFEVSADEQSPFNRICGSLRVSVHDSQMLDSCGHAGHI